MYPLFIDIVRHGLSMSNIDNKLHDTIPDWKMELSTMGEAQSYVCANKIINKYRLNAYSTYGVYVSPYTRTRQTWAAMKTRFDRANPMFAKVQFAIEDPRLREQEWGNLDAYRDADKIEKAREEFGPFYYRMLNGESGADVYDRCTMFLDTLYRDFERDDYPNNVIVVTHGFTMRCLVMRWLHASVEEFHSWKNPNNCDTISLMRYDEKHYCLINSMELKKK